MPHGVRAPHPGPLSQRRPTVARRCFCGIRRPGVLTGGMNGKNPKRGQKIAKVSRICRRKQAGGACMARSLEYHQAILDLLNISVVPSLDRLATIEERERLCRARLPASVRERFAIETAESLFYENSNQDELTKLAELGVPAEAAQGYLRVATENQSVVAWYVRLNEGEDPPVYDNNDEWNEDLS